MKLRKHGRERALKRMHLNPEGISLEGTGLYNAQGAVGCKGD